MTDTSATLSVTGIGETGGGSVNLTNTGAITTTGPITTTANGNIALGATGTMTIQGVIVANGSGTVTLTTTGGSSDILFNANVGSTSGNITASAGGNITLNAGNVTTTGQVSLTGAGSVSETPGGVNSSLIGLASFDGTGNGTDPNSDLIQDSNGNFFGTTVQGGAFGFGTVFEIAAGSGAITTLASFTGGANGYTPYQRLVLDSEGDLFGTTQHGGASGFGTVFELAHGSSTITVLASFNYSNGAYPQTGLVLDSSGDLFGAAHDGGAFGVGTVFEVAHGSNTITALASFNGSNGNQHSAGW